MCQLAVDAGMKNPLANMDDNCLVWGVGCGVWGVEFATYH